MPDLPTLRDDEAEEPCERVRHLKRGTEYDVLHRGVELQVARLHTQVCGDLHELLGEGDRLVIYQGDNGKIWAREESEFDDGRFEAIPPEDDGGQRIIDGLNDAIAWVQGDESRAELVTVVPVEPPEDKIKAAVEFALKVSLSGKYRWADYMADLYRIMIGRAALASKEGTDE